jgi:hypothetical protein
MNNVQIVILARKSKFFIIEQKGNSKNGSDALCYTSNVLPGFKSYFNS